MKPQQGIYTHTTRRSATSCNKQAHVTLYPLYPVKIQSKQYVSILNFLIRNLKVNPMVDQIPTQTGKHQVVVLNDQLHTVQLVFFTLFKSKYHRFNFYHPLFSLCAASQDVPRSADESAGLCPRGASVFFPAWCC